MQDYPATAAERNRWITLRRGSKRSLNPLRPYAFFAEDEIDAEGVQAATNTLFLTNRECRYRCLMCDLWQDTLDETTPIGAIPAQIEFALANLPPAKQIKLYNAGSFFDPLSVPLDDYQRIADLVDSYSRVIVECHPNLIGEQCLAFNEMITAQLEVAIGLETVNDDVLDRLNKRFTVQDFRRAAGQLRSAGIDLRVFVLVRPPFLCEAEAVEWARRTLDEAFDCGATACTLIPVRAGNGAMEALQQAGLWDRPKLRSLEAALEYGLTQQGGRVFADLWDLEGKSGCVCDVQRIARLTAMNRTQVIPEPVVCNFCAES